MLHSKRILLVLIATTAVPLIAGSAFRGSGIDVQTESVLQSDIKKNLMNWAGGGGGDHRMTEENFLMIQDQTRSTFVALPKNEYGNLEHSAVRYALHRFFVDAHGMYIKGLEPLGEAWNSTSPTGILEERVPAYIHSLFENLLGAKGFSHHEFAVLAATLEYLVYDEQMKRLRVAYDSHKFAQGVALEEHQVVEVLETYMTLFLLGKNHTLLTSGELDRYRAQIASAYPNWPSTKVWLRSVQNEAMAAKRGGAPGSGVMSFDDVVHVVEEIGRQYGSFQNLECKDLKKALVGLEDRGTGRVKIQDFYRGGLDGKWQFSEKTDYLRQLGVLDESDPEQLRVFIPNYINSPTNCIVSSSFFSVCCMDECEALLGHVEKRIQASVAQPNEIIGIVEGLASSTVKVPRSLTSSLRTRLDEIADHHGGRVPIHGRLFAQWMHHSFPRECPYPHLSGTTRPQTANEWMRETGSSAQASEDAMRERASVFEDGSVEMETLGELEEVEDEDSLLSMPWENTEELFVTRSSLDQAKPARRSSSAIVSGLVLVAALVAMALNIKQICTQALRSTGFTTSKRKSVNESV